MNDPDSRAWRCRVCHLSNALINLDRGSTGTATRYLRLKHSIGTALINDSSSIVTDLTQDTVPIELIKPLMLKNQLTQRIDINKFRYHLLRWIVN
jgi:hypothetical protein